MISIAGKPSHIVCPAVLRVLREGGGSSKIKRAESKHETVLKVF